MKHATTKNHLERELATENNSFPPAHTSKKLAVIRTIDHAHINIRELEEELQLWRKEVAVFLKLINSLEPKGLSAEEKHLLAVFEKELLLLSEYVLVIHKKEISMVNKKNVSSDRKTAIAKVHGRLRQVYIKMKKNALPLLPKMIPIAIW